MHVDEDRPTPHDRLVVTAVRELLTNVVKHARASAVEVIVSAADDELVCEVADDRVGLDPAVLLEAVGGGHIGLPEAELLGDLRPALDALPALAWMMSPDRRLLYANRATREYFGCKALEDHHWLDIVEPGDRDRAVANSPGSEWVSEYRVRRSDGQVRRALVRAQALRDDDGAVLAWVETATDVEDERRMGDEFRRQALDIGLVLAAADDAAGRERARIA